MDDVFVKFCVVDVFYVVEGVLVSVVFDEVEVVGSFGEVVEIYDEVFDFVVFVEEFMDLFFGGVEGVEGVRLDKIFFLFM